MPFNKKWSCFKVIKSSHFFVFYMLYLWQFLHCTSKLRTSQNWRKMCILSSNDFMFYDILSIHWFLPWYYLVNCRKSLKNQKRKVSSLFKSVCNWRKILHSLPSLIKWFSWKIIVIIMRIKIKMWIKIIWK